MTTPSMVVAVVPVLPILVAALVATLIVTWCVAVVGTVIRLEC